ncbi:NAD(P)H-quinone oxidoreductase [Psychrobium sp. 1_MG-2023]|uniref:NAD(P)H-quinone oxidoreductase n=1 Tax=Psychrobium sp. 1_MG-2023 TaxID=3062624 RepID=UPI000C324B64|nr:NAD(P)H-quinone oxidoreductase [Psychrobium sp. 1_MG-2023]MDP2560324.1 NAD(P)H-quinone oxidoreductase [Psychrobium sp. 1_MG-2023]PKF55436.1 hypothetical protein CW748_13125 [Alteromonadales bacterium alter-6D02]
MKCLIPSRAGDNLVVAEQPAVIKKVNDVLIDVKASGVNRADLLQLAGKYPPPVGESDVIGLEVAGVVRSAPKNSKFEVGQAVMALLSGGGYAEQVVVPEVCVMPIPQGLSFVEAAAIPEAFLTAYQALFMIAKLNERIAQGHVRVLIHAGASGVGSAAIQLAKAVGAEVFTTVSSDDKAQFTLSLGADHCINYQQSCFETEIVQRTKTSGVDVIVDFIGAKYLTRNINVVAIDGTIVNLAMLGGRYGERLDFAKLLSKRVTLTSSTLRNRSLVYKQQLVSEFEKQFSECFKVGRLKPVIDTSYRYDEVSVAFERIAMNQTKGKLILRDFT